MINLKQIVKLFQKFIDYKIGIAGALVMGGIVFAINYFSTYEVTGSFTAALKQATYTFFLGGTLMKSCEYLAITVKNRTWAILASIIIPSVFTLILTFSVHSTRGTPKPLESTIPTLIIIPATVVWGIKKRKQMEAPATSETGK
jgi:hypothetical protein